MNTRVVLRLLFLSFCYLLVPVGGNAQTTVRIAFNGFGGVAPLYLGQEAGIFKKQNLNLELIFIPGGAVFLEGLFGERLDLFIKGGPPRFKSLFHGGRVKNIYGVAQHLPYTVRVKSGL